MMDWVDEYLQDQRVAELWTTPDKQVFLSLDAAEAYALPLQLPIIYIERISYATRLAAENGCTALTFGRNIF